MLTEVLFGLSVLVFLAGTYLIGYKYGLKQNKEDE